MEEVRQIAEFYDYFEIQPLIITDFSQKTGRRSGKISGSALADGGRSQRHKPADSGLRRRDG